MNWLGAAISVIGGLVVRFLVLRPLREAVFDTFKQTFADVPGLVDLVNIVEFILFLGAIASVYYFFFGRKQG